MDMFCRTILSIFLGLRRCLTHLVVQFSGAPFHWTVPETFISPIQDLHATRRSRFRTHTDVALVYLFLLNLVIDMIIQITLSSFANGGIESLWLEICRRVCASEDPGKLQIFLDRPNCTLDTFGGAVYTLEVQNAIAGLDWLTAELRPSRGATGWDGQA